MTGPAAGGKRAASVLAASQPGPPSTSRRDRLRGARGPAAHHKRGMKVENREMRDGAHSRPLMSQRANAAETKPVSKVRIKFRTGVRRSSALVRINTRCADLTRLKTAFAEVQTAIGLSCYLAVYLCSLAETHMGQWSQVALTIFMSIITDETRRKATAWLSNRSGTSQAVGLRVERSLGKSMRLRRSGSFSVSNSHVQVEASDGTMTTLRASFKKSMRWSNSNGSVKLQRSLSRSRTKDIPGPLLSLMSKLEQQNGAGDLSPASQRYLPGVGTKWLRTRQQIAVRLSREGSGLDQDAAMHGFRC